MSKTVDVRSDIYSLGCLLFEMVTGRPPFEGGTALEVMTQHLTALPQYRAADELSRRLEPVVLRCLNKDPNGRFQTVEELQDDVNRVLRGVTLEPHCISSPAPLVVPGKKKLLKPLLIGATLGVVALTGFGVLSHKATTEMSRKTETFDQMLDRMNELHQHNDFGSARDMAIRYRNAVMKDPARHNSDRHKQWVADSYLYEGRELLALGDLAGSEYQFQKAVDKYIEVGRKPNDSLFELASVQMKAGKDTAAFKTFGRLETISPNYHLSEVQVLMAALEMRAGKLEQAEKRLQVLSQAEGIDVVAPNGFDTDFAIKAHLATLAFLRQDYAKCKNILIPLVEKSQTPQTLPGSQTFARLAVSCARCGERDLALHYKEKALARAAAEQQLCKTSPDKIVSQQVTRDIKQLFKDSGI